MERARTKHAQAECAPRSAETSRFTWPAIVALDDEGTPRKRRSAIKTWALSPDPETGRPLNGKKNTPFVSKPTVGQCENDITRNSTLSSRCLATSDSSRSYVSSSFRLPLCQETARRSAATPCHDTGHRALSCVNQEAIPREAECSQRTTTSMNSSRPGHGTQLNIMYLFSIIARFRTTTQVAGISASALISRTASRRIDRPKPASGCSACRLRRNGRSTQTTGIHRTGPHRSSVGICSREHTNRSLPGPSEFFE